MLRLLVRILTFRATREELLALDTRHLALGLVCTWVVGMGRFWDNPRVGVMQHLGLGSLVYVFVLSAFLWVIMLPLRPLDWSFRRLLTFVALVSPPGILYAAPFQLWMSMPEANSANTVLLAVVASWRLALLFWYLRRAGRLSLFATSVGGIFPMLAVVAGLGVLNLDKAVFDLMRGVEDVTPNDRAYAFLLGLMFIAYRAFIPVFIAWFVAVAIAGVKARKQADQ